MKDALKWLVVTALLLGTGVVQADPVKDNALDNYKSGWYLNSHQNELMTCPQTCKVWVNGVAEHENNMGVKSIETYVCKFVDHKKLEKPFRVYHFLYGNQFDKTQVCYATDINGNPKQNKQFYCLCIADASCVGPDLVVTKIDRPQWDSVNHRSIITAEIKNIGSAGAVASIARIIDPSTSQSTGAPYNAIANTPALAAGASVTVTFYLPYWVYNPNADLEVTADYKGMVQECNENNNTKTFQENG
ncbi:MAG: CARDB domain-containing protein [Thermodesulfovibrionales bacterium]|jgi:hypothetical protein